MLEPDFYLLVAGHHAGTVTEVGAVIHVIAAVIHGIVVTAAPLEIVATTREAVHPEGVTHGTGKYLLQITVDCVV